MPGAAAFGFKAAGSDLLRAKHSKADGRVLIPKNAFRCRIPAVTGVPFLVITECSKSSIARYVRRQALGEEFTE